MTYLLTIALVIYVGVLLVALQWGMKRIVESNQEVVRELRLSGRTRVRDTSMQSGARTEEQDMKRLGRATMAKRVVVGGDQDSELHTNLSRPLGGSDGGE